MIDCCASAATTPGDYIGGEETLRDDNDSDLCLACARRPMYGVNATTVIDGLIAFKYVFRTYTSQLRKYDAGMVQRIKEKMKRCHNINI